MPTSSLEKRNYITLIENDFVQAIYTQDHVIICDHEDSRVYFEKVDKLMQFGIGGGGNLSI